MLNWLSSNLSTILISIVLLAIVISIIRYLINQKKREKAPAAAAAEAPVPGAPPAAASVTTDSEFQKRTVRGHVPFFLIPAAPTFPVPFPRVFQTVRFSCRFLSLFF